MILKTKYIDHTTMTSYNVGDNVSHLGDDQKKFLTEGGHVEIDKPIDGGQGEGTALKAAELIAKIAEAQTEEEITALIPEGEARVTVLKAVDARKNQLQEGEE